MEEILCTHKCPDSQNISHVKAVGMFLSFWLGAISIAKQVIY